MHSLDAADYGLRITLEGFMDREAMRALLADVEQWISGAPAVFGVLLDLRRAPAFPVEAQAVLKRSLETLRENGMGRQAAVLASAVATLQAKRLLREAGALDSCRFLDASIEPEWEMLALGWIEHAIEPTLPSGR
jgi:hypothetical protein